MNEKNIKALLGLATGALDPELIKAAQKVAENIPADSPLRSTWLGRLLGAAKGGIEAQAEGLSPGAATAVEKATDFGDFLAGALKSEATPDPVEMKKEILRGTRERIQKAADPKAEVERIRQELAAVNELAALMKLELPPQPQTKSAAESFTEALNALNAKLEKKVEDMRKWAQAPLQTSKRS